MSWNQPPSPRETLTEASPAAGNALNQFFDICTKLPDLATLIFGLLGMEPTGYRSSRAPTVHAAAAVGYCLAG